LAATIKDSAVVEAAGEVGVPRNRPAGRRKMQPKP